MAENAYQKKFRVDLEVIDGDLYYEPAITVDSLANNYDGSILSDEDIRDIAAGDFIEVFRRDPQWTELPSGEGFVWHP